MIKFMCPETTHGTSRPKPFDSDTYVYETDKHSCVYEMEIESTLACPWDCITSYTVKQEGSKEGIDYFAVCNSRGICAADPYAEAVRCLCEQKYSGGQCQNIDEHNNSSSENDYGFKIAIAIVIVFLVIFVGVALYFFMKNRGLSEKLLQAQQGLISDEDHDDNILQPGPVTMMDDDSSESNENEQVQLELAETGTGQGKGMAEMNMRGTGDGKAQDQAGL